MKRLIVVALGAVAVFAFDAEAAERASPAEEARVAPPEIEESGLTPIALKVTTTGDLLVAGFRQASTYSESFVTAFQLKPNGQPAK